MAIRFRRWGVNLALWALCLSIALVVIACAHVWTVYTAPIGGFYSSMHYTSGAIVHADAKGMMFVMTIEGGNTEEIGRAYLTVDYSSAYRMWDEADALASGTKVTVGYLLPLNDGVAILGHLETEEAKS